MMNCLAILLFGLVVPFIAGPILIRYRSGIDPRPGFNEVSNDRARQLLPPRFFRLISELESLGFSFVAHLTSSDDVTKLNATVSLLVNRESQTTAFIARVSKTSKVTPGAVSELITFATEFEDGLEISTTNSPIVRIFRDVPHRIRFDVPQLKEAFRLYHIHLHYVQNRTDCRKSLPKPGREVEHFRSEHEKAFAEQAAAGRFYLDETTQRYRHTWSGAIWTTWRLLWPVKPILLRRQAYQGRLIAKVAGISNL